MNGSITSSAFTVWQENEDGPKGRLVINFSNMTKKWPRGNIRMEIISEFSMGIQQGDKFISMDI